MQVTRVTTLRAVSCFKAARSPTTVLLPSAHLKFCVRRAPYNKVPLKQVVLRAGTALSAWCRSHR